MDRFGNLGVFLIVGCILLLPAILFVIAIQKTMRAISPHNRKFEPRLAWLIIIPLVGNVWVFMMASRLSQSIELELKERNVPVKKNPVLFIGMSFAIVQVLAFVPVVNYFTRSAWFICFFIYWYQVAVYKRKLTDTTPILPDISNGITYDNSGIS